MISTRFGSVSHPQSVPLISPTAASSALQPLTDEVAYFLLSLSSYLAKTRILDARRFQQLAHEILRLDLKEEDDLLHWAASHPRLHPFRKKALDAARSLADRQPMNPLHVAGTVSLPWQDCPAVVFLWGPLPKDVPLVAFPNSRKPKLVSPTDDWVVLLRALLPHFRSKGFGFASSRGTATYDAVSTYARETGAPLLEVVPSPLDRILPDEPSNPCRNPLLPTTHLGCTAVGSGCPDRTRMLCRDRLVSAVADLHCVLELRLDGNLRAVLEDVQNAGPRPLWIFAPETAAPETSGNAQLLERFSERAQTIRILPPDPRCTSTAAPSQSRAVPPLFRPESFGPETVSPNAGTALPNPEEPAPDWKDYFYHYTRSCPGPWPGQTAREYYLALLEGLPLSGHTALNTLARIAIESRLRSSSRLTRGNEPTISWSPIPPHELQKIRRWNPALIRWTFEPFGLAIQKSILRGLGLKPTIYAPDKAYSRLKPLDRYRFQLDDPPRCSWRHEREWRLRGDLDLRSIPPEAAFLFVPEPASGLELLRLARRTFRIVTLDH